MQNDIELPQVVDFISGGVSCKAFVISDHRALNMGSCTINLGEKVQTNIEYLPGITRVMINDGVIWFDTSEASATAIEALFETGRKPSV